MLVERTVEDVIPNLKTNAEGLKKVLEDLVKTYKNKEQELDKWKASFDPVPRIMLFAVWQRWFLQFANLRCRRRTRSRLCRRLEGLVFGKIGVLFGYHRLQSSRCLAYLEPSRR